MPLFEYKKDSNPRIFELVKQITEAAQAYYSGESIISDSSFDALVEELAKHNPNHQLLNTVGWGLNIESVPGEKYPHRYGTVGSLRKARNWKELRFGKDSVICDITPKLDGITCAAYFEEGKLVRALTRGDGVNGIDITNKFKMITRLYIPSELFTGCIRGEIIMSNPSWNKYKQINVEAKNSRNSTAGLIGTNEVSTDLCYLDFIPYSISGADCNSIDEHDWKSIIYWMYASIGNHFIEQVPREMCELGKDNYETILTELYTKWSEYYPLDGLVITTDVLFQGSNIIYDSVAFKFPGAIAQSTVTHIDWTPSKTGYMIPRIWFEEVPLDGSMNQKVTGYNAKFIQDSRLGKGAVITISKQGDIIPNIKDIISHGEFDLLQFCTVCEQELIWEGVHLACPNSDCESKSEQDLLIWLEFLCPIDNFGETLRMKYLREALYSEGEPTIDKLMNPERLRFMYRGSPGAQDKLYNTMIDALRYNQFTLVNVLRALNIPRLGDKLSKKFSQYPNLVKKCIDFDINFSCTIMSLKLELRQVIGEADTESIIKHLHKFKRLRYIYDRIIWEQPMQQGVEIKGDICITGKLSVKRSVLESQLQAAGYNPVGKVSKDTLFLMTDDPDGSSSKNRDAAKYGITKISEGEFRQKYM